MSIPSDTKHPKFIWYSTTCNLFTLIIKSFFHSCCFFIMSKSKFPILVTESSINLHQDMILFGSTNNMGLKNYDKAFEFFEETAKARCLEGILNLGYYYTCGIRIMECYKFERYYISFVLLFLVVVT